MNKTDTVTSDTAMSANEFKIEGQNIKAFCPWRKKVSAWPCKWDRLYLPCTSQKCWDRGLGWPKEELPPHIENDQYSLVFE